MFDEKLGEQVTRLMAEHGRALYRYYKLLRELEQLEERLACMEAGLIELERVKKSWEAQSAVDQAQAAETEEKKK